MRDAITAAEAAEMQRGDTILTSNDPNVQLLLESLGFHAARRHGWQVLFERQNYLGRAEQIVPTTIPLY